MISIQLQGGLGNVMFQVAALEDLAVRFGYKTCYPNLREHISDMKTGRNMPRAISYAEEYYDIFKNFNWNRNAVRDSPIEDVIKMPFKFRHMYELSDNTHLIGYFQSESNWGGVREFAQNLFEPSDIVTEQLRKYDGLFNETTGFIHVRRTDYLKYPNVYSPVDIHYIDRAIEELYKYEITQYLVFSDDMQWCKSNLIGDKYIFIENEKDYVEMFLMARCDYRIIANSSFSWWGSYLSKKGGVTIAPKKWIVDPKIDDSFVCPWYWERI